MLSLVPDSRVRHSLRFIIRVAWRLDTHPHLMLTGGYIHCVELIPFNFPKNESSPLRISMQQVLIDKTVVDPDGGMRLVKSCSISIRNGPEETTVATGMTVETTCTFGTLARGVNFAASWRF